MSLSDKFFARQRSLHQILGGGLVADAILWRRKDLSVRILVGTVAAWLVFEKSGYTLLSLVSSVLLLSFTILFLWAKLAATLNRPAPPLPRFYLSEATVNRVAAVLRDYINMLLSISQDIALGGSPRLFLKVATGLLLVSIIGSLPNFQTLAYTSLVIVLTVPAVYEKYENHIDKCMLRGYRKLQHSYLMFHAKCTSKVQNWISETKKLS